MTDTSSSASAAARIPAPSRPARPEPTGWVGWIVFAAVMMVMIGVLHAIEGLVAIFKDSYYVVAKSGLVFAVDYTVWGWVHLSWGLVTALAGVALLTGRMWARALGVVARPVQHPGVLHLHGGLPALVDHLDRRRHPGDLRAHRARPGDAQRLTPSRTAATATAT